MKFATAIIIFLLIAPKTVARADEDVSSTPSLRAYLRKTPASDHDASSAKTVKRSLVAPKYPSNGGGKGRGKGKVLAKGNFGRIDMSNIPAAQKGGKDVLKKLSGKGRNSEFVPRNNNAKHARFTQRIRGMDVEGAALVVHAYDDGTVYGINGELVDESTVPSGRPDFDADVAIQAALDESRVPAKFHKQCTEPTLTVVRGLDDGEAHRAWTCTVRYDMPDEATGKTNLFKDQATGKLNPFKDQIFAKADGEIPGLIQIHALINGDRSLDTQTCNSGFTCTSVTTSSNKVTEFDEAINAAHNYAIDTYNYYFDKHDRDSIDGEGMTLISRVHYDNNYVNAFWDGVQMTYGDGDGVTAIELSRDRDIVAHELTHGVTSETSGLIYNGESGALNEALSDIFAALVEQANGESDDPSNGHANQKVWKMGEDVWTPNTPGDALRYMYDPARGNDYDYWPTRYTGSSDSGGVHWNSGIANLAAYLMVNGGTHPRGKTTNTVTPLGDGGVPRSQAAYDALGQIFYRANTECLTPVSDFEDMRWCTADVFGGDDTDNIHAAWDAVGVPTSVPPPPTPSPTPCTGGMDVEIELTTDNYPQETAWTLSNQCGTGQTFLSPVYSESNTMTSTPLCLPNGEYDFVITDIYGDGICCGYGQGSYEIFVDGDSIHTGGQFGGTDTKTIGSCVLTTLPPTGAHTTPPSTAPSTSPPTLMLPTSDAPTTLPPTTAQPTSTPTTDAPTINSTGSPTTPPPTTAQPTNPPTPPITTAQPINSPTPPPTTAQPTNSPTPPPTTAQPTSTPTTDAPTINSTGSPTTPPPATAQPTNPPTPPLTTAQPTNFPTPPPTTAQPTSTPTTDAPTTNTGFALLAQYDFNLGAPKCSAVGRACTSGDTLLDGKQGMNELNPPNTLDSCTDGNYGSYHSDESIDMISIKTLDGGQLQAGKTVEIEAKVWAWSNGSYDMADFYYSANPTAAYPTWTQLASLRPPYGGLNTFKVEYSLPDNSDLQAVRVNFRFLGQQSACSGGSYDDVDDLVFAVATRGALVAISPQKPPTHIAPPEAFDSGVCAPLDRKRCQAEAASDLCEWQNGKNRARGKNGKNRGCYAKEN